MNIIVTFSYNRVFTHFSCSLPSILKWPLNFVGIKIDIFEFESRLLYQKVSKKKLPIKIRKGGVCLWRKWIIALEGGKKRLCRNFEKRKR